MDIPIFWQIYVIMFFIGACVGSFLNVVIYRVPIGESIIKPGSHCPNCKRPIKPYENIPLISFILLGGKCAGCKKPISIRYPLVEAFMGALVVLMLWKFGFKDEFFIYTVMAAVLLALSAIDIQVMRLPNMIVLVGAIFAVVLNLILRFDFVWQMFLGALVGLLLMVFMSVLGRLLFHKDALGMGDVKLAVMIGLYVGLWYTIGMFVLGVVVGAVVGIISIIFKGGGWAKKIPFGPFLATGAIISLLWGEELWCWYVNLAMH